MTVPLDQCEIELKGVLNQRFLSVQVNVKNKKGYTPLFLAVSNNDLRMVKLLVEDGGADVDEKNGPEGFTSLFQASARAYNTIVEYLLSEADADPNIQTNSGFAPVFQAAFDGFATVVKLFLEQPDTQINIRNGDGDWLVLEAASEKGYFGIVKMLIDDGRADVNLQDRYGYSALFQAAKNGHTKVAQLLAEEGQADIEMKHGEEEITALWQAANNSRVEVVQYLLDVGADANTKNRAGFAPLFWASFYGYDDVVELLVNTGKARVDDRNGDTQWTALHGAAEGGHPEIVKFLILEGKANANLRDKQGITPLYDATEYNRLETVKAILKYGNVNVDQVNGDKAWTVLMKASSEGFAEIVRHLLTETDTTVDLKTNDDFASIHIAAANGHLEVVKLLVLEGKANVDIRNGNGEWTALDAASDRGYTDIVRFLIQDGGATVNVKDNTNKSPFFYAAQNGHLVNSINKKINS